MPKKIFDAKFLREEVLNTTEYEVENTLIDHNRWSLIFQLVFKFENKFYSTVYTRGATEYQDERPFDSEKEVLCVEVQPIQKITTVYEPV